MQLTTSGTLNGKAGTATAVTYTIMGDRKASGVDSYEVLGQGQLASSTGALLTTSPVAASTQLLIASIQLNNTTASPVTGIVLYVNGTAASNQIVQLSLVANGSAVYTKGEWKTYDSGGGILGGSGIVTSVTAADSSVTVAGTTTNPTVSRAALTGDVTASAGSNATTLAAGNAGNLNSGTLLAARMPALTGDVTSSAGSTTTAIASGVIVDGDVNASANIAGSKLAAATTSTAGSQSAADKARQDNLAKGMVNVLDYGVDNTGTNDISTGLTNAIAALPNGGVVYFPAGTYKLTAAFTVATAHITLRGSTKYNSVIFTTSTTVDILVLNQYYITIEDLGFQGTIASAQVTSRSAGFAINANGAGSAYSVIRRCSFTYQWDCINLANQLSVVDDCEMRYYAHSNVVVNHNSDHQIHKVVSDNNAGALPSGSGIDVQVTASLMFSHCNIIHANYALNLSPAVGVTIPSIKGVNTFFDTSVIGCRFAGAGSVFRSEFTNCWFSSMSTAGILMAPTTAGANVDGITWVNCDIYNNVAGTTTGVSVTTANVGKWKMVGCSIAGWTTGIALVPGSSHYPTIECNTIGAVSAFGVNTTGISIASGAYKGLVLVGNDCNDNTTAITIAATPTFTNYGNYRIIDNPGINPHNAVVGPPAATPVLATTYTNTYGFRVLLVVKHGATANTGVTINGAANTMGFVAAQVATYLLEPGDTWAVAGGTAPTVWVWNGL